MTDRYNPNSYNDHPVSLAAGLVFFFAALVMVTVLMMLVMDYSAMMQSSKWRTWAIGASLVLYLSWQVRDNPTGRVGVVSTVITAIALFVFSDWYLVTHGKVLIYPWYIAIQLFVLGAMCFPSGRKMLFKIRDWLVDLYHYALFCWRLTLVGIFAFGLLMKLFKVMGVTSVELQVAMAGGVVALCFVAIKWIVRRQVSDEIVDNDLQEPVE